eukprot:Protomagalhaensia_sp_Gyna_25__5507@NODE_737_length_2727_cov_215_967634_g576_i0_p1_GENE_NODE_737_length_2727_cov_215_967634_g576_i0NODE_737_length_2727_cov_215_967634_g576_i0_p1_ORF_typecomplete_len490_score74_846PGD/PF00393_19/1_7e026PGD/PF00393_19/2_9e103NAD_binding_2/PF03446_15/7_5e40Shikimate_DH/PF01488_20/3_1e06Shikimate_DH/PF01488_20/5_5e033HCDH_N/PF02737_18/1_6e05NAD_Gly3P_dh_N/PF01210_23/0_0013NAD_Gly3P_dh_N/PF01210_23/59IlvN/PF07991_12/0_00032IlvN/PF07991_12/2_3e022Hacid_dh_C/PF02826_19/
MAVMGRNLAMNAAEKGFRVAVYNRTTSRMEEAVAEAKAQNVTLHGFVTIEEFVQSLKKPRKIVVMVQAGAPVERVLNQLSEVAEEKDIVVDAGNEYYTNTEQRYKRLSEKKIHFMGMGVSGGEEGARHGPSIMPGGDRYAWEHMEPILTRIAAQAAGQACCRYMGHGAAGHYVKMVHNGIEYGDMQLISEVYNVLTGVLGYSASQCADAFETWNKGKLQSYLIEITATVLRTKPLGQDTHLVDSILDVAAGKGTGKWTVQEAAEKGVPCPTIAAALDARNLSAEIAIRNAVNECMEKQDMGLTTCDISLDDLEAALYAAKICSYAQGLALLAKASETHEFNLVLKDISSVWMGGCIIRAEFLSRITQAFEANPRLQHLFLDKGFAHDLVTSVTAWRSVVMKCQNAGIPVPALSASLAYFDALRASHLPLNLVQAQRDYFGAHTFRMSDGSGPWHADWLTGEVKRV